MFPQDFTVLAVDDDEMVLMVLEDVLCEFGVKTLIASSGDEALEILGSADKVDVLITDVKMPGANGYDLVAKARRQRSSLPVIYVTGLEPGVVPEALLTDDQTAILFKPYSLARLLVALGKVIPGTRFERPAA